MSPPSLPTPRDPSEFFKPENAIEQWKEPETQQPPSGFPPEVPRRPPNETPEWAPRSPQEVPPREPTPTPDWSPSSGDLGAPIIDEPHNPTEHRSGGLQPRGEHDAPAAERLDAPLDEDMGDDRQSPEPGGNSEESGAQLPRSRETADAHQSPRAARLRMRAASEEVYY